MVAATSKPEARAEYNQGFAAGQDAARAEDPKPVAVRSFWQASTTAQNLSAWPRALRSASKLTLPEGRTRRLMAWTWPTSSRSQPRTRACSACQSIVSCSANHLADDARGRLLHAHGSRRDL